MTTTPQTRPVGEAGTRIDRVAVPHRYLMCPPTYFDVTYAINPWMDPSVPVDVDRAYEQWDTLRTVYADLGHVVDLIDPEPGLPDMIFAANGGLVVDGTAIGPRFHNAERRDEADAYLAWFSGAGFTRVHRPAFTNEGEGDFLLAGDVLLAGTGFRSDPRSHLEVSELLGREVVTLDLVDPRFYHLDTALCVLDESTVGYLPAAFSPASQAVLATMFPDAILATEADAIVLGLNAVSDGRNVVLASEATGFMAQLADRGFTPIGVEMDEIRRAGGSVKCCTLELRG